VTSVFRNPDHTDDGAATGATPVVAHIERLDTVALAGQDAVVVAARAGGGNPADLLIQQSDQALVTLTGSESRPRRTLL
jgi:hypothetical protein